MKKITDKLEKYSPYIAIFLLTLIVLAPIINFTTYISGHDTAFHVSNIEALKQAMQGGNWLMPKIYPTIANGFGYSTSLFYGILPHYITAIISFVFSFSTLTSMKIVHILVVMLSGIFMYNFANKIHKNKKLAFLSSITYITSSYFLSEIFIRDAYSESMVFVFLPLLFNSLYELLYLNNSKKFYLLFVISVCGLILTHLISTLYAAIFCFIFLALNYKRILKKENIKMIFLGLLTVLGITSFFTVPLIEQHLFSDVFIFNLDYSGEYIKSYALDWKMFIPWYTNETFDGIRFFFSIPMITLIIYGIYKLLKKQKAKDDQKKVYAMYLILGIIALITSSKLFPWEYVPKLFLYIQFPWRILLFSTMFFSIFIAYGLKNISEPKLTKIMPNLCLALVSFALVFNNYVRLDTYSISNIDISTAGIGAINDYLPIKVLDNYEYYQNRSKNPVILKGKGNVIINKNYVPFISLNVQVEDGPIEVELPLLYYYGYKALNVNDTTKTYEVKESQNGFVSIVVDENAAINVNYVGSTCSQMALYVSLTSIIIFVIGYNLKKGVEDEEEN